MIIVDHLLMGAVIGLSEPTHDPIIISATIVSSIIPDIDLLKGNPSTTKYFKYHRGATHSLFLTPLYSSLIALLFFLLQSELSFGDIYTWVLISYTLHLGLDVLNSFGTKIFYPFSKKRIAFDLIFEFDIVISLILLSTIILELSAPYSFSSILLYPFIPLTILVFYLSQRVVSRYKFKKEITQKFISETKIISKAIVPAKYWRWKGIIETIETLYVFKKVNDEVTIDPYKHNDIPQEFLTEEIQNYKDYSRYLRVELDNNYLLLHNLIFPPSTFVLTANITDGILKNINLSSPQIKYSDY